MKTLVKVGFVCVALLWAGTAQGQTGITGSSHDFSGKLWNPDKEICAPCHVPHSASNSGLNAPLWDREITDSVFTQYNSNTLDATVGQPSGESKLCLSCHDGTVGLENFGATTGGTANLITGASNVGIDLSDDHPVSFDYAAAQSSDNDIKTSTVIEAAGLVLFAGNMECSTCHNVHDQANNHLRISNAVSALCLTCHDK